MISSQVESPDGSEITANKEKPDSIRFNLNGIESSSSAPVVHRLGREVEVGPPAIICDKRGRLCGVS